MFYVKTAQLTPTQLSQIQNLHSICETHDRISIPSFSSPDMNLFSDFPAFFLCYDKKVSDTTLIGFYSVFFSNASYCQLYSYIHPDYRRQGIFLDFEDAMFEQLDDTEVTDIVYPIDSRNELARTILKNHSYTLLETECSMLLPLSDFTPFLSKRTDCTIRLEVSADAKEFIYSLHFRNQQEALGSLHFYRDFQNPSTLTLFSFEMKKKNRGKHLGSYLLHSALCHLKEQKKAAFVLLQVTKSNTIAYSLYQKFGFKLSESIDYYIL